MKLVDTALSEELKDADLDGLELVDYQNFNDTGSQSGFAAVAFRDPDTGAVGFSFRGTENMNKPVDERQIDMVDNIYTALIGTSKQAAEALAFYEKNRASSGGNYLFGHSKGGELASQVYAKYHNEIERLHLYNPQPINSIRFNKEKKAAFQSEKVDVVIIDGDTVSSLGDKKVFGKRIRYVVCNGTQPGFFGPHILDSTSFCEGSKTVLIEQKPYAKYPVQKKFCALAKGIMAKAQWGLLPGTALVTLLLAKAYERVTKEG